MTNSRIPLRTLYQGAAIRLQRRPTIATTTDCPTTTAQPARRPELSVTLIAKRAAKSPSAMTTTTGSRPASAKAYAKPVRTLLAALRRAR